MAASAEPMAKVMEMVKFTSTPISCAAPLSSETARMALPIFVREVNIVSATMMMMQHSTVTMASSEISSAPSKRRMEPMFTSELKLFGLEPQISCAEFCNR